MGLKKRTSATVPARLDQQKYTGEVRKDPDHWITCRIEHPTKSFTITFNPKLLEKKIEKYGKNLILPTNYNPEKK